MESIRHGVFYFVRFCSMGKENLFKVYGSKFKKEIKSIKRIEGKLAEVRLH